MAHQELTEFTVGDDLSIMVESDEPDRGFQPVSRAGGRGRDDNTPRSFTDAMDRVGPLANQLVEKLKDLVEQPEEVEVEFGIKLSAAAGVVVAKAGSEANFKITLTWRKGEA